MVCNPGCHLNSAALASSGLCGQEDSSKAQKTIQLAGLYFLGFDTYHVGPRVSPLELQVTQQTLTRCMRATLNPGSYIHMLTPRSLSFQLSISRCMMQRLVNTVVASLLRGWQHMTPLRSGA